MMRQVPLLLSGALFVASAQAVTIYRADITHDQESGANGQAPLLTSTGDPRALSFGTAEFILNDAGTELAMVATIFNIDVGDVNTRQTPDINDDLVAAHIHAPAPLGSNGGVRWGFFGSPDNDTSDNIVTPF